MERQTPADEEEFEALMEEVDEILRTDKVPRAYRELRGLSEVSRLLKVAQQLMLDPGDPTPGRYDGPDLTRRVSRWFRERYGSSMASDPRPGRMAVLVRDDVWFFHFPLLIGGHELFCSLHEESDSIELEVDVGPTPRFNILDALDHFPTGLRRTLTSNEQAYLWESFHIGLPAYLLMRDLARHQFVREALVDHDSCVHQLIGESPHPGQAMWSALQGAEKMMKAALAFASEEIPRGQSGHDLGKMAGRLKELGLDDIQDDWVKAVQCGPSVRYGEVLVTVPAAVSAHHAALAISRAVGGAVRRAGGGGKILKHV